MKNKKKLTAKEFELVRIYLGNFNDRNIEAIRRILVNGTMQKDIASEFGMSKEAVSAMVSRVWKIHLRHGLRPAGWRIVEVALPSEYAEVVEELANILQARGKK